MRTTNASGLSKRNEIKAFSENRLWEETNKNFSVLSLSEVNDNILMWSHYSDGHAGICLDLTFEMSEKLHRVQYTDVRPEIYFTDVREQYRDHERFNKSVISTLITKAPDWAYEKEWRCIDFGGCGERPMPHGMLTGSYSVTELPKPTREWFVSGLSRRASPPGFTKQFKGMVPSRWTLKKSTETRTNKRIADRKPPGEACCKSTSSAWRFPAADPER